MTLSLTPGCGTTKALIVGLLSGAALTVLLTGLFSYKTKKERLEKDDELVQVPGHVQTEIVDGVAGLIGNTPLMKIKSLSDATGCLVLV